MALGALHWCKHSPSKYFRGLLRANFLCRNWSSLEGKLNCTPRHQREHQVSLSRRFWKSCTAYVFHLLLLLSQRKDEHLLWRDTSTGFSFIDYLAILYHRSNFTLLCAYSSASDVSQCRTDWCHSHWSQIDEDSPHFHHRNWLARRTPWERR